MEKKNELDDYLFTLDVCMRDLSGDAHPDHYKRIKEIKNILSVVLKNDKLKYKELTEIVE